ncbi:MAG: excinuclease ABC subunit UvrC [Synergistales bacterium]|nr:excinuclease ABC subunit UvrC [Synergistales bacterium]
MERSELLEKTRSYPDRPGVYLMHDGEGRVLYVGKAKSLKKRVASYFRRSGFASPRLRKLVSLIEDISTIRTESEVEALVLEAKLIKRYQPFFNVELKMGERYPYIKVTSEPFPRVVVTRHHSDDGGVYFGPFTRVSEVRQLLRLTERYFPLRTCTRDIDPSRPRNRPCVKYALGRCLGPCAGKCGQREYGERVADVILLLQGQTLKLVERLRARMERAASELAFEEAGRIRDTIRAIWRYTRQRTSRGADGELSPEMWDALQELQSALGLKTLPWRIDGFDISHFSGGETYGVVVVFEQGRSNASLYRKFAVRDVEGIDDFRSMEEVLSRRYRHVLQGDEPVPQLIVIDGGEQQLRFARKALEALGIEDIPSVALAKREELVYSEAGRPPLALPEGGAALRLLQQVRDEAHRYAVGAHRSRRDSRLRRSALEEIPGVGKKRAARLLGTFGSVQRISTLEAEEIASVPGIGRTLAATIRRTLRGEVETETEKR